MNPEPTVIVWMGEGLIRLQIKDWGLGPRSLESLNLKWVMNR